MQLIPVPEYLAWSLSAHLWQLLDRWVRKVGGDPMLASLIKAIQAEPELHHRRQACLSFMSARFSAARVLQTVPVLRLQVALIRWYVGGTDVTSIEELAGHELKAQESLDQKRIDYDMMVRTQTYLLESMREAGIEEVSRQQLHHCIRACCMLQARKCTACDLHSWLLQAVLAKTCENILTLQKAFLAYQRPGRARHCPCCCMQ